MNKYKSLLYLKYNILYYLVKCPNINLQYLFFKKKKKEQIAKVKQC
jgi:hypothetical protein